MSAELRDGYWYYDDGTRLKAISGAQDLEGLEIGSPSDWVTATQMDFTATWSPTQGDLYVDLGGVPYGDPEAAGYVGLADFLRSGGDPEGYLGTVSTNSSLSDAVRGGSEGGAFDPATFTPYQSGSGQPSGFNITNVIDSVSKGIAALGGVALGALALSKAPSGGQRDASGRPVGQTLAQRVFGMSPTAAGNAPSMLFLVALMAAGGFLFYMLARR